jgi:hypothetical protein
MTRKIFFVFICCTGMVSVYAQSRPLEGTWALKSASVWKISGVDTVEVEDIEAVRGELDPMLSDPLEFRGDTLLFPGSNECGCGSRGVYHVKGDSIEFSFTAAPVGIVYRIEDDRLYFRQQFIYSMESPFTYLVFTAYNRKK